MCSDNMVDTQDFDPSHYPAARLLSHTLQKGFQAGSLIGLAVGAPILAWRKKSLSSLVVTSAAGYGALGGLAVSGVMTAAKYVNMDQAGLEDRVYRLYYNEGQNRVDLLSQIGMAFGASIAAGMAGLSMVSVFGGAAVGSAAGVVAHVVTAPKDMQTAKSLGRMYHELKR